MGLKDIINKIKDEELDEYLPIFNRKVTNIDERNNGYIVSSNKIIKPLEINETCLLIYNLCNGSNSILFIIKHITQEYSAIYENAKIDVLNILYNTWKLNILQWKGGKHPFSQLFKYEYKDKKNSIKYSVLLNGELHKAIKLTNESKYINPYLNFDLDYNKASINNKVSIGVENFFELKCNDNLIALFSIRAAVTLRPVTNVLSFDICYCYINENFVKELRDYIHDFFRWCCEWYIDSMKIQNIPEDINIYAYIIENTNQCIEKILLDIGFFNIGTSVQEIGLNNINVLSYNVKNNCSDYNAI